MAEKRRGIIKKEDARGHVRAGRIEEGSRKEEAAFGRNDYSGDERGFLSAA